MNWRTLFCTLALIAGSVLAGTPSPADVGGTVTVKGRFAVDGSVAEVKVVFSEPAGKFDDVALRAIRTWRVKPWWPKGAKRGYEFAKTLNFYDESALRDPAEVVPIVAVDPSGVSLDDRTGDARLIPNFRYRVRPEWPSAARSPVLGGWVRTAGEVGTDGRVTKVEVEAAHPPGVFDTASLNAVRKWRYNELGPEEPTAPRLFKHVLWFDAGVTTLEMMQAQYFTQHSEQAGLLLADLARLCPDRYPRVDDKLNQALSGAWRTRALPAGPVPQIPVATPEAIELMLRYSGCLFSSWEQLTDPRAYYAAAQVAWFDLSIGWRGGQALCERGVVLGLDPAQCRIVVELNESDRLQAKRWLAGRFAEGYQALIAKDPRAISVAISDATKVAIAEAKQARINKERHQPVNVLIKALRHADQPEDVAILRLALARVYLDIGSRGEAREEIDRLLGSSDTPWYARQMARVMLLVTYEGWHDEGGAEFERTVAALNQELGLSDKFKF